ncbi:MAG: SUMF1/EgtB/PvdO family nonheme iron enzyme [Polyangiaceae bacterium]|nr:SUMF1/EgtB/PvdO family nonheme iron enzyme [Polyangiaceae bacterium]
MVDRAVLVTPPARFALALSLAAACSPDAGGAASTGVDASSTAALATASASATGTSDTGAAPASASAAAATASGSSAPSAALARTDGCPEGMVRVEGDYCPDVEQTCKKHHPEYERDQERRRKAEEKGQKHKSTVSERCLEYAAPTVCKSKDKRRLSFCIDPFEYPNEKGQLPALLISWTDAKKTCEGLGKRLCTEDEFNFACEGPEMLPYTYGFVRDPAKCSIDKPYRKRSKKLFRYDKCMQRPACKQHLAELDQRLPTGSLPECVSPFGVYDMNGNINEWVELPGKKYPDRSGLKGGWWGPVRGRCRPTVDFHKEDDYGYEEGFRCCADTKG